MRLAAVRQGNVPVRNAVSKKPLFEKERLPDGGRSFFSHDASILHGSASGKDCKGMRLA